MALWYYRCAKCSKVLRLPKATKFSLDKVKVDLHCPKCGGTKFYESTKASYEQQRKEHD